MALVFSGLKACVEVVMLVVMVMVMVIVMVTKMVVKGTRLQSTRVREREKKKISHTHRVSQSVTLSVRQRPRIDS